MTIEEAQKHGEELLCKAAIESFRLDTSLLLEKTTGKSRTWLFSHADEELDETAEKNFSDLVSRRAQRIPLVHLTNLREFYGLELYINEHVLTPRVETETMVDYAIKYAPQHSRLIDIGTGSGAIAIAIKKHRPDLEVWATDISEVELAVAKRNAQTHSVEISFQQTSLFDDITETFATIVTNLPYLREDAELMPEVQKEPAVALFGGEDGLDLYRQFLRQLPTRLDSRGYLFTECDPWQHEDLIQTAAAAGLTPIEQDNYFILGFQSNN